jgi:hypothetical protein
VVVLHDAVSDADDGARGEKRGAHTFVQGAFACHTVMLISRLRFCSSAAHSQRSPALACAASRRKEDKTMAVSVWREGKVSKTHLVHCAGVVSSAVGSCAQIGLRGRARRRSVPTAAPAARTTAFERLTEVEREARGMLGPAAPSQCDEFKFALRSPHVQCSFGSQEKWRKVPRLRGRYRARAES